jgi:hypothetical protein
MHSYFIILKGSLRNDEMVAALAWCWSVLIPSSSARCSFHSLYKIKLFVIWSWENGKEAETVALEEVMKMETPELKLNLTSQIGYYLYRIIINSVLFLL